MKKTIMRKALYSFAFAMLFWGTATTLTAETKGIEAAIQIEDAITSVAENASKAVVVITNRQKMGGGMKGMERMREIPEEFRRFFRQFPEGQQHPRWRRNQEEQNRKPQSIGKGSGVIIRDTGYIVTNFHVIKDQDELEVKLHDGRIFDSAKGKGEVEVVGIDEETDLAVLKVGDAETKGLPILKFADSDKIRIGQFAIAVGAPFNLDYSVTVGHVSQMGRYDMRMTSFENYIQTDASINPGNSGGPLLNIRGEVIGINEFIMTGGGMSKGSVGIGFAIASSLAKSVSESIMEHGKVVRPFLGISMQPLDDELKQQFNVEDGVLISEVIAGDPAEKAGLKAGDVVTKIGDQEVRSPHDLLFEVLRYNPGDKVKIVVNRDGKEKTFHIVARQRGDKKDIAHNNSNKETPDRDNLLDELGLELEATDKGLFILSLDPNGVAASAQLMKGDRIIEVNRIEVKSKSDVQEALKKSKNNVAVFYVERRGGRLFVGVTFPDK